MKKALALILAFVLVIGASVAGTMAYLTAKDEVKNTFTVGNVQLALDETDVDKMGVPDGTARVKANEYKLIPGHTYTKDPMVHVLAGSEECYVRLLVNLNFTDDMKELVDNDKIDLNVFVRNGVEAPGLNLDNWTKGKEWNETDNTRTYEFRFNTTVKPSETEDLALPTLFDGFKVPEELTGEQIACLSGLNMKITAQAIQADGFADADAAWAAFK